MIYCPSKPTHRQNEALQETTMVIISEWWILPCTPYRWRDKLSLMIWPMCSKFHRHDFVWTVDHFDAAYIIKNENIKLHRQLGVISPTLAIPISPNLEASSDLPRWLILAVPTTALLLFVISFRDIPRFGGIVKFDKRPWLATASEWK